MITIEQKIKIDLFHVNKLLKYNELFPQEFKLEDDNKMQKYGNFTNDKFKKRNLINYNLLAPISHK